MKRTLSWLLAFCLLASPAAFAEVSDALAALARLHPFGVEDHELVSISV